MKFTPLLKSIILEQSRFEVLYDALTQPSVDKQGKKQKHKFLMKKNNPKRQNTYPVVLSNLVSID